MRSLKTIIRIVTACVLIWVGMTSTVTASTLSGTIFGGATPLNFTTLWAWDNMNGAWYFYAPSLDAQGPAVLKNYTDAKHYLDFAAQSKTLGLGAGFWVNKP